MFYKKRFIIFILILFVHCSIMPSDLVYKTSELNPFYAKDFSPRLPFYDEKSEKILEIPKIDSINKMPEAQINDFFLPGNMKMSNLMSNFTSDGVDSIKLEFLDNGSQIPLLSGKTKYPTDLQDPSKKFSNESEIDITIPSFFPEFNIMDGIPKKK